MKIFLLSVFSTKMKINCIVLHMLVYRNRTLPVPNRAIQE